MTGADRKGSMTSSFGVVCHELLLLLEVLHELEDDADPPAVLLPDTR